MPTFDYRCNECGTERKDVFKGIHEDMTEKCCGKDMQKLITGSATVIYKGNKSHWTGAAKA